MKKSIQLFSALIVMICTVGVYAQTENTQEFDVIYKLDQTTIECRVTEMNTTEVKYHYPDRPGITLAVDIGLVDYVILSTGEKVVPENTDGQVAELAYAKQRNMAAKVAFLTPLQGYTNLGFEYSRKPLQSIEGSLGIIGLGNSDFFYGDNPRGVTISAGYRFYSPPLFSLRKIRNAHRMTGMYIQPSIAFSQYSSEHDQQVYDRATGNYRDITANLAVSRAAFLVKFGQQRVYGDRISLDYNVGIGYGAVSENITYNVSTQNVEFGYGYYSDGGVGYGFSVIDAVGLALSSTLKIGFLFKK